MYLNTVTVGVRVFVVERVFIPRRRKVRVFGLHQHLDEQVGLGCANHDGRGGRSGFLPGCFRASIVPFPKLEAKASSNVREILE